MESPRTVRIYGLEKNRLEALADGIFAVSLTLLVLDIKLPDNAMAATSDELIALLIGLERHFVIYVISFTVIGMYWINHHIQFHFVRCTDRRLIWINMLYLLLVSFLPFATDLIGDHKELVLPCEVYGAALQQALDADTVRQVLGRRREASAQPLRQRCDRRKR